MGVRGTLPVVVAVSVTITMVDMRVFVAAALVMSMMAMRVAVLAVLVAMVVLVRMPVFVAMGVPLDVCLAFTATAYCTHQSTSSSFIRNSSPAVTCSW